MKSAILGQFLRVCLPAFVILVPAASSSAFEPMPTAPVLHNEVSIHLREGVRYRLSASTRSVMEVRTLLESALAGLVDPAQTTTVVRDLLSGVYGARMQESSAAMGYSVVWDGTQFVLRCTSLSTFAIDFGALGTVVVETQDVESWP